MLISAGTVHDFAKYAKLGHMERHHFASAEAAVFKKHERGESFFVCLDKLIALFKSIGSANLHCSCLARLECCNGNLGVTFPGTRDYYCVYIFIIDDIHVIDIFLWSFSALFFNRIRTFFYSVLIEVTHCGNVFALFQNYVVKQRLSAAAEADIANSYIFHF